jgi:cytochrome oxidase Cu insertion factor (SCO1/SenC/PrrC family)
VYLHLDRATRGRRTARAWGACRTDHVGGDMALEVGKKAPDFGLLDQDGKKVKLSDFKGKSVVVFFYPKALTSG